jgi:hypothetical protein
MSKPPFLWKVEKWKEERGVERKSGKRVERKSRKKNGN